jgi:hypothetical protein
VLLSGHDPHWLREYMGLRVSLYQSRRVWKVDDNAATQGTGRTRFARLARPQHAA